MVPADNDPAAFGIEDNAAKNVELLAGVQSEGMPRSRLVEQVRKRCDVAKVEGFARAGNDHCTSAGVPVCRQFTRSVPSPRSDRRRRES